MMSGAEAAAILLALFSMGGSAAAYIFSRRERLAKVALDQATAAKTTAETYSGLVEALERRLDNLRRENQELCDRVEALEGANRTLSGRLKELEKENADLRIGVTILVQQLRDAGIEPRWNPGRQY